MITLLYQEGSVDAYVVQVQVYLLKSSDPRKTRLEKAANTAAKQIVSLSTK